MSREDRGYTDPVDAAGLLGEVMLRLRGPAGAIQDVWHEIVGDALARHATPTGLVKGVLRVRCDSAVWASEIQLGEQVILERLQGHALVDGPVKRIRCDIESPAAGRRHTT